MGKIDIEKIKVAIFDFDDTLAIHKNNAFLRHHNENKNAYLDFYKDSYLNPELFYDNGEPCDMSKEMHELICVLRNKGIKMYCLSGMDYSFNLKAKQFYVDKYYGEGIEVITSKTQEAKVDGARIIAYINECDLNEILFVDDLEENIIRLNDAGINAVLIGNVDKLLS